MWVHREKYMSVDGLIDWALLKWMNMLVEPHIFTLAINVWIMNISRSIKRVLVPDNDLELLS